jgi:hypothetical protein
MGPVGDQRRKLCYLFMVPIEFVDCDFVDTMEGEDRADAPPIRAIYPHQGIC